MKKILIDCRGFVSRSQLHTVFVNALALPDHYGNNLDALHDCLTGVCEDTCLILQHWDATEKDLGRYGQALKHVLEDAAKENPHFSFTIE